MRQPLPADMFDELCPSSLNPIRFGDKWAALVIRCLEHGPRRFSELRVPLRRVTAKVLTQSLRSLERDGLVSRTVHAEVPPHVEYELTPLGRSLLVPIAVACAWTERHWDELLDARESYPGTTGSAGARTREAGEAGTGSAGAGTATIDRIPSVSAMGAVKPWHLVVLMLCCLVPTVLAVGGGVWALRRSRRDR